MDFSTLAALIGITTPIVVAGVSYIVLNERRLTRLEVKVDMMLEHFGIDWRNQKH